MQNMKISAPNTDVSRVFGSDILFDARYPLAKLDTKSKVSFQNIRLFFQHEVPNAPVGTFLDTLVYSFPHGYNYTPEIWSLCKVEIQPVTNFFQPYFQERGILAQSNPGDFAQFFVTADEKNINFWVKKWFGIGAIEAALINSQLLVRVYCFVDGILDNA